MTSPEEASAVEATLMRQTRIELPAAIDKVMSNIMLSKGLTLVCNIEEEHCLLDLNWI